MVVLCTAGKFAKILFTCMIYFSTSFMIFAQFYCKLEMMNFVLFHLAILRQFGANGILDGWEENLAVITANRTKDDELVLIHLGDSLWKDRSDVCFS